MANTIEQTLTELAALHAPPLDATQHADRATAISKAHAAIDAACDLERAALQHKMTALQAARERHRESATAAAEASRRARSNALMSDVFATAPDSIASLVHEFRIEPTRTSAGKIRAAWDRFNARAVSELGAELNDNVMGALIADDIVAAPGFASAISAFLDVQFGGDAIQYALHEVTRATTAPGTQVALTRAESLMLERAARHIAAYPGRAPDPEHAALHALRRQHATLGDLRQARQQLEATFGAKRQAEFEASYRAPESDSWSAVRRWFGIAAPDAPTPDAPTPAAPPAPDAA